jgi:hypothetical protein
LFSTISSDPWIARRDAPHERGSQEKQRLATVATAEI